MAPPDGQPLLSSYLEFVRREVTWLPLVLALTRVPSGRELGRLYSLEFCVHSCPPGLDLRLLTPSCVSLAAEGQHVLSLELHRACVEHLRVNLSATFACADGEPCLAESEPLDLRLLDLLLPLPVASRRLQRLIVNELRAADLVRSFMTLQASGEQRQQLMEALQHLQLGEGQYCGLLLPDNHVLLEIEERDKFCFVSVFTDRASALKHFYHFLRAFSTIE